MTKVTAVTNRDPRFLKETYAHPMVELTDHERHIKSGTQYISWDGNWRVWKMTPERVPIPRGRFPTLNAAVFAAQK